MGSPTSDPPIFSWKSRKDCYTCPKIHFRGSRYLKRGPLQGFLDFYKNWGKIHKNLRYGLEPPIFGWASSVIPFRKALAILLQGFFLGPAGCWLGFAQLHSFSIWGMATWGPAPSLPTKVFPSVLKVIGTLEDRNGSWEESWISGHPFVI